MGAKRGQATKQSGYRGVVWSTVHKKWSARFTREGRTYNVGLFSDEHTAAAELSQAIMEFERDLFDRARAAGRGTCGVPLGYPTPIKASDLDIRGNIEIARSFLRGKEVIK
jgi:hypothetical protein